MITKNRLYFLRESLSRLLKNVQDEEEVIIIDGGSTDGSKEYLDELYETRKISAFVSEKDRCEGHAWNKGFLLANGNLIKIISDDDVYHYPSIQQCKVFMEENEEVEFLGTNGASINWIQSRTINEIRWEQQFKAWTVAKKPFWFCGLGLMIRKSSLAYLGLFDTYFKPVDVEFVLRSTFKESKLAFYTGICWVNNLNPDSISVKALQKLEDDAEVLERFYGVSKMTPLHAFLRKLKRKVMGGKSKYEKYIIEMKKDYPKQHSDNFRFLENWIYEINTKQAGQFLKE